MSRKPILVAISLVLVALLAAGVSAHNAGPCNDAAEPGHSAYAQHHIRFMAENGDIGHVDHDGDGMAHAPGAHQGFSACDPAA